MPIIAEAHTKLLLFGEHAAVYGHPAVGVSLPQKVQVSLHPAASTGWHLPHLEEIHQKKLDRVLTKLDTLFPEMSHYPPFSIHVNSEVPIGTGFGSSAALCVALIRAISLYLRHHSKNVWSLAHELEQVFHKNPSGIDTGLSLLGRTCFFEGNNQGLPEVKGIKHDFLPLVVGALQREFTTQQLIHDIRSRKEQNENVSTSLSSLGEIARKAAVLLASCGEGWRKKFGSYASQAHKQLCFLGLSTRSLDSLIQAGISFGASGGKLSGAGGGGAYFLVAQTKQHAQDLTKKILQFSKEKKIPHAMDPRPLSFGGKS